MGNVHALRDVGRRELRIAEAAFNLVERRLQQEGSGSVTWHGLSSPQREREHVSELASDVPRGLDVQIAAVVGKEPQLVVIMAPALCGLEC